MSVLHLRCSVTGCNARVIAASADHLHATLRDGGWSRNSGVDLCPTHVPVPGIVSASIPPGHADPIPVVIGGGGGAGGGRRAVADSIRVVELSREIRDARQLIPADILDGGDLVDGVRRLAAEYCRATQSAENRGRAGDNLRDMLGDIRQLIPADILEDGDTVDGVRRLVAEYQRVTAAHAQAADARDLLQAQQDELRAEYDRRRDSAALFAQVYDALLPTTPGLLPGQVPEVVRERLSQVAEVRHERDAYLHQRDRAWGHLDAIRDGITQFGQEKLSRDQLPEAVRHLNSGYDRLQEIHRDTREKVGKYSELLSGIASLLGDPFQAYDELPDAVRHLVADRDACAAQRDEAQVTLCAIREALGVPTETSYADLLTAVRAMVEKADRAHTERDRTADAHDPAVIWAASIGIALGCPGASSQFMLDSARVLHAQHGKFHAIIRAVRDALGVPDEVADEDVPTVARTMVENLDKAHRDLDAARAADLPSYGYRADLPPYSYREGFGNPPVDEVVSAVAAQLVPAVLAEFEKRGVPGSAFGFPSRYSVPATPPLTVWSDNGGEAFIPHTEDGTLTNTDAAHGTPAQTGQEDAAEVPDCDRCDKRRGGRWLVPGALVLTQDGKETHVCLECLRVLNGGKL